MGIKDSRYVDAISPVRIENAWKLTKFWESKDENGKVDVILVGRWLSV